MRIKFYIIAGNIVIIRIILFLLKKELLVVFAFETDISIYVYMFPLPLRGEGEEFKC